MYHRGDMDIRSQKKGFNAFMHFLIWFSGVIGLLILGLTLIFAAGVPWFFSLVVTAIIGIFIGLFTDMKITWYLFVAGSFVLTSLIGLMIRLASTAL